MDKRKLIIIDGDAMLYRFFSVNIDFSRDGVDLGTVFGSLNNIQKLFRSFDASHLIVAFDQGKNTFRHRDYPEYKANRPPRPESLILQKKILISLLDKLGVSTMSSPEFEADDLINSMAKRALADGFQVVAEARDKDMFSMMPEVTMWDALAKKSITPEDVLIKTHGVECKRIADWLALLGDSADNIPGVDRVGAKTAGQLLKAKGGTLEGLLNDLSNVPEKIKADIHNNRSKILWFRNFMLLRDDAPVPSPESCSFFEFGVRKAMDSIDLDSHRAKPEEVKEQAAFAFTPNQTPLDSGEDIQF